MVWNSVSDMPQLRKAKVAQSENRLIFLDTLRFFAAAFVVFQHYGENTGELGESIVAWISPGVFGVVLFFIVSGFVMPMAAAKGFEWKSFAIRRFFRIYPLVLSTFAVVAFLAYVLKLGTFGRFQEYSYSDWFFNLLLIQDFTGAKTIWGVTWTLILEIIWYFIFTIAMLAFGRSYNRKLSVIFPIFISFLAIASLAIGHRIPLARPGMIYAAVLGCQFYGHLAGTVSFRRILVDIAVFMAVTTFGNVISFGYFHHPNITLYEAVVPWLLGSLLFSIFTLSKYIRSHRFMNNAVISWLATVSFSTYLLHPLAWSVVASFISSTPVVLILALLLTVVFSSIGYYFIELPMHELGRSLSRHKRLQLTDVVAPK